MEKNIIKIAKQVINTENKGLKTLTNSINNNFVKAINILKKTKGRIILTGIGKSGIIANKISSTLSIVSLGTINCISSINKMS